MKISVTQEDIDSGRPCSVTTCPIALAIRRASRNSNVAVAGSIIVGGTYYRMPAEAMAFIQKFDSGEEAPVPFEFELKESDLLDMEPC